MDDDRIKGFEEEAPSRQYRARLAEMNEGELREELGKLFRTAARSLRRGKATRRGIYFPAPTELQEE